jgi:hypothetical protein
MVARIIAQVLIVGGQIVGRAFANAYKKAAADAARNGGASSSKNASNTTKVVVDDLTRKTGMSLDESLQILNVKKNDSKEKILKVRL